MNVKTLQEQLAEVEAELRNEHQRGALMDSGKVEELAVRRQELNGQISAQSQAEREQAIEEKVHSEAVPFAIEGVDFTALPAQLITIIEKVVKVDRRRIYAEHAVEVERIENEYGDYKKHAEDSVDALLASHTQLELDYETVRRELKEQTEETVRLIADRNDARKNRDNAAAQLEEAKAEIERLKGEIDDYQKAKVFGERQAQSVIDVTPNEAEEINEAIKLFTSSENWGAYEKLYLPDGTYKVVKRDELAEWKAITPPALGGGEIATETFQDEAAEADAIDSGISAPEAPSLDFRDEEEHGVDEGNAGVEVAESPVSRQEFNSLAARVAQLEQSAVAVA